MAKLNTSTPSGFPEFSPAEQRIVREWKKVIAKIFEKHGFPILETPLVERVENFTAKGGNPKEIYVLDRLHADSADQDSAKSRAIRFDHTVPLALFVARHFNELAFPFRRAVIGPVMRGERAQKGRFRQFDQCDIDVIGNESLSLANDAQMVEIIAEIFQKLMPEQKFMIRINNRKILTEFFKSQDFSEKNIKEILNMLDAVDHSDSNFEKNNNIKFDDYNVSETWGGLSFGEIEPNNVEKIKSFFKISGTNDEILENLAGFLDNEKFKNGVKELVEVVKYLRKMGISEENFQIDLKIARGLDYYTGTVYETNLLNEDGSINTSLGSICSGGRYDDLAGVFTGKNLPGVGISIGLTRLLWQLFDAKIIEPKQATSSDAIVLFRSPELLSKAIEVGQKIRGNSDISVENYFETKKIQKQFAYAEKMGIPVRVIVGENDIVVEAKDGFENLKKKIKEIL
jgi:histidyl-tRNA synthetase